MREFAPAARCIQNPMDYTETSHIENINFLRGCIRAFTSVGARTEKSRYCACMMSRGLVTLNHVAKHDKFLTHSHVSPFLCEKAYLSGLRAQVCLITGDIHEHNSYVNLCCGNFFSMTFWSRAQ